MNDNGPENHRVLLERLLRIPVEDNGEALVSIKELCPNILLDICQMGEPDSGREPKLRETAAGMLARAQESLPDGHKLKIWEAHRPMEKQEFMRRRFLEQLMAENPDRPGEELERVRDRYVARADIIPPHLTGGAVDLTVVGPGRKELDMGTDYLDFVEETHTDSHKVGRNAAGNRKILSEAMEKAGFVNYSFEWWHFSYGDRYWAYKKNKDVSIYDKL